MFYNVKIEKFEGPLDLLLELIEKEKLEITEISLSKVTDQFLDYLEKNQEIEASILADFLVVATQLLLIKSRTLIPIIDFEDDENLSAEELEFRLKEYKKYKDAAKELKELFRGEKILYERKFFKRNTDVFYPGENLSLENLKSSFETLISYFEKQEKLEEKSIEITVSISEKISEIKNFLNQNKKLDFGVMTSTAKSKIELVVSFLALLELIKQEDLIVKQERIFGNILIENLKYDGKKEIRESKVKT